VAKPLVFQRVVNTQIDELVDRHRTDLYTAHPRPAGIASEDRRPGSDQTDETPPHGVFAPSSGRAATQGAAPTGTGGATGGATQDQIRDRLIELDDLRQRGILSEEEFATKKAELLDRI
jgi:hypothetical protein